MTNKIGTAIFAAGVVAIAAGGQFLEEHVIKISTVCTVGVVVMSGAVAFTRRMQRLEDQYDAMSQRITDNFKTIDDRLSHLWCQQPGRTASDPHPGTGDPPKPQP